MRSFVIDSKDLANALTRPNSVTIAWPFIITNKVENRILYVCDYGTYFPQQGFFPIYDDIEEFRRGLEIGFNCTIHLTGDDKINIGKL